MPYIHKYSNAYINAKPHTYIHKLTQIHTATHTHIHTYIHPYRQAHIHRQGTIGQGRAYITCNDQWGHAGQAGRQKGIQAGREAYIQGMTGITTYIHIYIQAHMHIYIHTHTYTYSHK